MAEIKRVVILGATGNMGRPLMEALVAAGFEVAAASRSSHVQLPVGVRLATLDISSETELEGLFHGQDAIVEAIGPSAAAAQQQIVKAARRTGIKHIITPEFAGDTFNSNAGELMIYEPKINAQKALIDNIVGSDLRWTAIITGPWYDWAIANNLFWVDKEKRTVTIFGSGNQRYSICRTSTAARAVVDILSDPQGFTNRPVYVADYTISTNELLSILESIIPGWNVKKVDINNFFQLAKEMWGADRAAGVKETLGTKAYMMLGTYGIFEENNKYGADFGDKAESSYIKGIDQLRAELEDMLPLRRE